MKTRITLLMILMFAVYGFSWAQVERFVKAGGSGTQDGTSWENAAPDFITTAYEYTGSGHITIYVAEGQYGNINFDKDDDNGTDSNLPDGIDVNIYGGYPNDLQGTSTCGYNPELYKTLVEPDGSPDGGESVFRMDNTDGNLTVKGMHFINPTNDFARLGSVLTVDETDGNMITFEDIYVIGSNTDPGVGVFHIRDNAANNTLTITNIIAKNSVNTTIATQTTTENNTIIVNNGLFTDNRDDSGGVMVIRSNYGNPNLLQVTNSYFCGNSSTQVSSGGGAIAVQNRSKAEISNCYFINNNANNNGGAINAITNGEVSSTHNYFRGNTAGGYGGAISTNEGKFLSTGNDVFYQNTASSNGGAIRINGDATVDPNILIENATFIENTATSGSSRGGAISIIGDVDESDIRITGSLFCNNTANDGGAISSYNDNAVKFLNNTFIDNTSNNDGGAVYIFGASKNVAAPAILLDGNKFQNNTTDVRGGALFVEATGPNNLGNVEIRNCDFKGNMAGTETTDCRGGAIMFNGPGGPKASAKIENCDFEDNRARYGGAIASRIDNSIYILNSNFWDNIGYSHSGAVLISGDDPNGNSPWLSSDGEKYFFMIEGSVFHSNSSGTITSGPNRYGGGGVFVEETANNRVYIYNTEFYENSTSIEGTTSYYLNRHGGGAINVDDDALFRNVTFSRNEVNSAVNLAENGGGSDVQDWIDDVLTFENSKMQMPQASYASSGWTFDATTTYDQNSVAVPAKPTSLTSLTCTQPNMLACSTDTSIFSRNLPTHASLMADCSATEAKISVSLDSLSSEDFPIMYTWISPDPVNYPNVTGTANTTSDLDLTGFEKIGEYTLQIMDNQGCKDTVKITMDPTVCSVLPIQLLDFNAENLVAGVRLTWKTASESNNNYFDVERSSDGIIWETIGQVSGKGTSTSMNSYRFMDDDIIGQPKTLFYRLQQVDFNGAYSYSPVLSVRFLYDTNDINIYPNPANTLINIDGMEINKYHVEIRDSAGELKNISRRGIIDVSKYIPGIYLLIVKDDKNQIIHQEKVMIIK